MVIVWFKRPRKVSEFSEVDSRFYFWILFYKFQGVLQHSSIEDMIKGTVPGADFWFKINFISLFLLIKNLTQILSHQYLLFFLFPDYAMYLHISVFLHLPPVTFLHIHVKFFKMCLGSKESCENILHNQLYGFLNHFLSNKHWDVQNSFEGRLKDKSTLVHFLEIYA